METQALAVTEPFDRPHDPVEGPRSEGQAKWESEEDIDNSINYKSQVILKIQRDWDVKVGVLEVHCDAPKRLDPSSSDGPYRLHTEGGDHQKSVESGEIYDESQRPAFLRDNEQTGEEKGSGEQNLPDDPAREQVGNELPDVRKMTSGAGGPWRWMHG